MRSFDARLCGGAGAGAAAATKSHLLVEATAVVMVVRKQGSYLEENEGSGGIKSASKY